MPPETSKAKATRGMRTRRRSAKTLDETAWVIMAIRVIRRSMKEILGNGAHLWSEFRESPLQKSVKCMTQHIYRAQSGANTA